MSKWTKKEEALFASKTNREICSETGRTYDSVTCKRKTLGLVSPAKPEEPKTYEGDVAKTDEAHWHREHTELSKKYARALRENTLVSRLVADIKSVAPVSYSPRPPVSRPPTRASEAQTALLEFSDTHVGKVVSPDQTLGLAEYNFRVFLARLKYLEESIISITTGHTTTKIDALVIAMLGDMLDGGLAHGVEAGQRNTRFAQFYAAGHAIAQFFRNLAPYFPEVRIETVVGNHCVDLETEILTRRGWLRYDQVTSQDVCLGLGSDGVTGAWQQVKEVVLEDQSDLGVSITNREFDFCGTEHHRFYYWVPGHPMLNEARWSEITKGLPIEIPATCKLWASNGSAVPDNCIELSAAVLTDGSINAADSRVIVYQKPEKEAWVKAAFDRSGLKYTRRTRTRKAPTHICGRAWKGGETSEEASYSLTASAVREFLHRTNLEKGRLPGWVWDMTHEQFDRFLAALVDGDGTRHEGREGAILYGKSESWLGEVQALCALHGVRASLKRYQPNNANPNPQYRLNLVWSEETRIHVGANADIKYSAPAAGAKVWCVITDTENWFCRRNGISYFTGNTRWESQKKMPTENRFSNLDLFLYALVEALTRDIPNLKWDLNQQPFCVFNIYDWVFYAAHGDHLRGGDKALGIPNHAFARQISTTTQLFNKYGKKAPNYYLTGHLHREITLPHATGSIMVNGGFPGLDNYALAENFNPVDPTQRFFFIHPKYGRTAEYSLSLKFATSGTYPVPSAFPLE